jgi:tetratricopeptide (TPR) repeat protein
MSRTVLCLLVSSLALGQTPRPAPIQTVVEAHWKSLSAGRFGEAAARREEARSLLDSLPADDPDFENSVQTVAQLYEGAAMYQQSRDIRENALTRAAALGESSRTRINLLTEVANAWQQDRNVLKALSYWEKAVAAIETAPTATPALPESRPRMMRGSFVVNGYFNPNGSVFPYTWIYQRLADTYRQLGRKEDAAAILTKLQKLVQNDTAALASFYESQNRLEDAAGLYKKLAQQAAMKVDSQPGALVGPFQSLANLYQRQQRIPEAVATLQQAVDTLSASTSPDAANQAIGLRQQMAGMLDQAGQIAAADKIFEELLAQPALREDEQRHMLIAVAYHLSTTKRGAQAVEALNSYLSSHPTLSPVEESQILSTRSNVERQAGNTEKADEDQRLAMERQTQPSRSADVFLNEDGHQAQALAIARKLDAAFALSLQMLDKASRAVDRDQAGWLVSSLAFNFAANGQADRGEQLYRRLFSLVDEWSVATLQPALAAAQNYPRFLMMQPDRLQEAVAAIDRYRALIVKSHGAGTGWQEDVLRLTIDIENNCACNGAEKALPVAQELLALEESTNGKVSEPYLRALETLAGITGSSSQPERALPLWRQAFTVADIVLPVADARRAQIRSNAASAYLNQNQLDEAGRLIDEAVAIANQLTPPQPDMFKWQQQQFLERKANAAAPGNVAPPSAATQGTRLGSKWFNWSGPAPAPQAH